MNTKTRDYFSPIINLTSVRNYLHYLHYLMFIQIFVQRERVRKSIARVCGSQSRNPPIQRRVYCVPGPNALWHLDGNHKMIRWGLVIHGAIDGFSRVITYLHCASKNWAKTVLNCFTRAT